MNKYILILVLSGAIMSCKQDNNGALPQNVTELSKNASKVFADNPTVVTANNYVKALITEMSKPHSEAETKMILNEGIRVCDEYKLNSKSLNFLYPLVKNYGSEPETNDRLYKMANTMSNLKKNEGANIIFYSLKDRDPKYTEGASKITEEIADVTTYIDSILGKKVFEDPDLNGLNKRSAQNYVDACESYALANPNSEKSPVYLFKASEIARSIRTFPKLMSLYDWISNKYPNYEKSATVLFLKGFVLENDLQSEEGAKKVYEEFLNKYPEHELADDVEFLLEHLGKSDEEILKIIEGKKKANES